MAEVNNGVFSVAVKMVGRNNAALEARLYVANLLFQEGRFIQFNDFGAKDVRLPYRSNPIDWATRNIRSSSKIIPPLLACSALMTNGLPGCATQFSSKGEVRPKDSELHAVIVPSSRICVCKHPPFSFSLE